MGHADANLVAAAIGRLVAKKQDVEISSTFLPDPDSLRYGAGGGDGVPFATVSRQEDGPVNSKG